MNLDCDNREGHMRRDHVPSFLQGVKEGRSERIVWLSGCAFERVLASISRLQNCQRQLSLDSGEEDMQALLDIACWICF